MPTLMSFAAVGMSSLAQYREGQAAKAAADFNADVSKQQSEQVEVAKKFDVAKLNKQRRKLVGKNRAQAGAFGGSLSGSPLEIINEVVTEFEIEKSLTVHNRNLQKTRLLNDAQIERFKGKQQLRVAKLRATATLLKGTSDIMKEVGQAAATGGAGGG